LLPLALVAQLPACRPRATEDVGALVTARTLGLIHLQENRLSD